MKTTIATIALLLATAASAGPFGYEMGQKIEGEPDGIYSSAISYKFITHNVPAPFTRLVLEYTPNAGLCHLLASVTTGFYHKAQFGRIGLALRDKYGVFSVSDEESLFWSDVNVDNIYMISLRRHESSMDLFYIFTNYGDCSAEAKTIRKKDGLQDVL